MKVPLLAFLLVAKSLLAGETLDQTIIGKWRVTSIVEDGKARPYPKIGTLHYEYNNDGSLIIQSKGFGELKTPWTARTNSAKNPKEIDHINKDGSITTKGIYRFSDDHTLEILFDRNGPDKPRPSKFGSSQVEGLMILKRVDAKSRNNPAEQGDGGQPATRPESK